MEHFPYTPTEEQASQGHSYEPQDPNVRGPNQQDPNPHAQDLPDPLTTAALLLLPYEMGQQYLLLWQNAPDKEATARLIRETVRLLQLTEANARAHPTSARAGATPSAADRAESDKKRALMKTINKIKDYNGKIQGDATREHLYDCERYFQRVAEFSSAELTD
jgi:hypothetical protein